MTGRMLHCPAAVRLSMHCRPRLSGPAGFTPLSFPLADSALRELTLVIPGLLWPADSLAAACRDLSVPALETLLSLGTVDRLPSATLEETLAALWGLPAGSAPYAALRVAGSGGDPADASWMCVDPAHLRFARETLVLTDNQELDIAPEEATQLVAALNAGFADIGEFMVASPGQWNLRLHRSPQLVTHPVAHVLGRNIEPWLPGGPDGAVWRRTINEMQMLLHAHPVNDAREAAGRPVINSVWPWGAGALDDRLPQRYQAVFADLPLARGLAQVSGAACEGLQAGFPQKVACPALALLDDLHYPALALEVEAWQAALQRLETNWFKPLLDALRRKQFTQARIVLTGDAACVEIRCHSTGWWKFWQRPTPLQAFVAQAVAP